MCFNVKYTLSNKKNKIPTWLHAVVASVLQLTVGLVLQAGREQTLVRHPKFACNKK